MPNGGGCVPLGKALGWLLDAHPAGVRGFFFGAVPLPLTPPGSRPSPTYPRLTRPPPDLPDPPQIYPTPPRFTRPPPRFTRPPSKGGEAPNPFATAFPAGFLGRLPHLPDPSLSTFISPFAHSPSPLPIPYPPPFFLSPSVIKERSGRWGSRGKKRPGTAFSRGFSPSPPKKGGRVSWGGGRVKKGGVGKEGRGSGRWGRGMASPLGQWVPPRWGRVGRHRRGGRGKRGRGASQSVRGRRWPVGGRPVPLVAQSVGEVGWPVSRWGRRGRG